MGREAQYGLVILLLGTFTVVAQPYFRPPTATELFNLRRWCAALGEKMNKEMMFGSALTGTQTSHYNPRTGHCYVDLVRQDNGTDPRSGGYFHRTLYDGQTGALLAFAKIEKGKRVGMGFGRGSDMRDDFGFSDANENMDKLMKEE
jgi:hypothetical protein